MVSRNGRQTTTSPVARKGPLSGPDAAARTDRAAELEAQACPAVVDSRDGSTPIARISSPIQVLIADELSV